MKKSDRIHQEILELSSTLALMLTEREWGCQTTYIAEDNSEVLTDEAKQTFNEHRHVIHTQLQNLRKMIQNTHHG